MKSGIISLINSTTNITTTALMTSGFVLAASGLCPGTPKWRCTLFPYYPKHITFITQSDPKISGFVITERLDAF
jgi:hypothetical protein